MSGRSSPSYASFEDFDIQQNFKIQTKSIEATLLPLVTQISALVNAREVAVYTEKAAYTLAQVGLEVCCAVDRFVGVGELVAEENGEIRTEMLEACRLASSAGHRIERHTEIRRHPEGGYVPGDKAGLVRAARHLLSAVTRVLLLADRVLIRQLLLAKERVAHTLSQLEAAPNFSDFIQLFAEFGKRMVALGTLSGERLQDLKDEVCRMHMAHRRSVLEKSTALLLAVTKTALRHPDNLTAQQLKAQVVSQMRLSLENLDSLVTKGKAVQPAPSNCVSPLGNGSDSGIGVTSASGHNTACRALKELREMLENTRMTGMSSPVECKLTAACDSVLASSQDFTDSSFVSHEDREIVLHYGNRLRKELQTFIKVACSSPVQEGLLEAGILKTTDLCSKLEEELVSAALKVSENIVRLKKFNGVLEAMKQSIQSGSVQETDLLCSDLEEQAEQVMESCKLLRHTCNVSMNAASGPSMTGSGYGAGVLGLSGLNLLTQAELMESYAAGVHSLLLLAAQSASQLGGSSRVARECLLAFIDVWTALLQEVSVLRSDVIDSRLTGGRGHGTMNGRLVPKHSVNNSYSSLPRPGKHGASSRSVNRTPVFDAEEKAKIAKLGLEMKLISAEMEAEAAKWPEPNNDIVKRARMMSELAFTMYLFTKGEGPLKTTNDLFRQAESFSDCGVKLYTTVVDFIQRLPERSTTELERQLDRLPSACQALSQAVKRPADSSANSGASSPVSGISGSHSTSSTVTSKAAVFAKVDTVIHATRDTMSIVARLVTSCFVAATEYNIDYRQMSVTSPLPFSVTYNRTMMWSPLPPDSGSPRSGSPSLRQLQRSRSLDKKELQFVSPLLQIQSNSSSLRMSSRKSQLGRSLSES